MRPEDLVRRLTSMAVVAELVEAFDNPVLRDRHGWCLSGWTFDLVPWGVRFLYHGRRNTTTAAVLALALPEGGRAALPPAYTLAAWPSTVLLLG